MLTPDALAHALQHRDLDDIPALPGRRNHLHAGVLVPLIWRSSGPTVIATLRSARLREHPGEVAFPGGKRDPSDLDLVHTALREAHEEIGLNPVTARVLGPLSAMPLYTSEYRLVPTVAAVPDEPLHPQPGEVAAVLELDLALALSAPAIDAVPWDREGIVHYSPVFELGGHVMYGATAHTLYELLLVIAGSVGRPLPGWRTGRFGWGGAGVVRTPTSNGGDVNMRES